MQVGRTKKKKIAEKKIESWGSADPRVSSNWKRSKWVNKQTKTKPCNKSWSSHVAEQYTDSESFLCQRKLAKNTTEGITGRSKTKKTERESWTTTSPTQCHTSATVPTTIKNKYICHCVLVANSILFLIKCQFQSKSNQSVQVTHLLPLSNRQFLN